RGRHECPRHESPLVCPQNADDAGGATTAEVLSEADGMPLQLAVAGFATDLLDEVADLRNTGGADRVAFRFQTAAGVDGHRTIAAVSAFRCEEAAASAFDEAEVLHGDN